MLFPSGLIAGGAMMSVVLEALVARALDGSFNMEKVVGSLGTNGIVATSADLLFFAVPLFMVSKRRRWS